MFFIKIVPYYLSFNSLFASLHLEFCSSRYDHFPKAGHISFNPEFWALSWFWQFWCAKCSSLFGLVIIRIWVCFLHKISSAMSQLSISIKFWSFGPSYTKLWPFEQVLFIWPVLHSGSVHYPDLT